MKSFNGKVLFLDRSDINTDEIIPAKYLTEISKEALKPHLLEAFTELYLVWPDELVRKRLEEMFLLIRDTFVDPEGYLKLYFQADWTHVAPEPDEEGPERMKWFFNHFTYGHDVETAFLLGFSGAGDQ